MAEDEHVDVMALEGEIAERLGVAAINGVPAAKSTSSSAPSGKRRQSPSPPRDFPKSVHSTMRAPQRAKRSKPAAAGAVFADDKSVNLGKLEPFRNLLPQRFPISPNQLEKLYDILSDTGVKAYLHLQRFLNLGELQANHPDVPILEHPGYPHVYASDKPDEELIGLPIMDRVEHAMESLRESIHDKIPTEIRAKIPIEMAATALNVFAAACVRRSSTRQVEALMVSSQEAAGGQGGDLPADDAAESDDDLERINADEDNLMTLACITGYTELVKLLIEIRGSVDYEMERVCTPLMEACASGSTNVVRLLIKHGADVRAVSATLNTPLIYACAGGHEDVVVVLLTLKTSKLDHRNENAHCALMEAASAGHVDIVRMLMEFGAKSVFSNMNSEFKESPLTMAAYKGHAEMVEFLLANTPNDGPDRPEELHTALMEASMDGHVEVARLLLAAGAPVNLASESFESPLTLACCGGHDELAKMLLESGAFIEEPNDESYTPLMEAAREGHATVVRVLLERGAQVNAQTEETGETAMTVAACGGFTDVLRVLSEYGGDLELGANSPLMEASQEGHLGAVAYILGRTKEIEMARSPPGPAPNSNFPSQLNTSFSLAAENGHLDVLQLLLKSGAKLNHEIEGRTALMKAAKNGYIEIVQFLVGKGADVNHRSDTSDATALSLACASGVKQTVKFLLDSGADPNVELKDGVTCVLEAAKNGHVEIVELMLDHSGVYPQPVRAAANKGSSKGPSVPPPPPPTPSPPFAQPGFGYTKARTTRVVKKPTPGTTMTSEVNGKSNTTTTTTTPTTVACDPPSSNTVATSTAAQKTGSSSSPTPPRVAPTGAKPAEGSPSGSGPRPPILSIDPTDPHYKFHPPTEVLPAPEVLKSYQTWMEEFYKNFQQSLIKPGDEKTTSLELADRVEAFKKEIEAKHAEMGLPLAKLGKPPPYPLHVRVQQQQAAAQAAAQAKAAAAAAAAAAPAAPSAPASQTPAANSTTTTTAKPAAAPNPAPTPKPKPGPTPNEIKYAATIAAMPHIEEDDLPELPSYPGKKTATKEELAEYESFMQARGQIIAAGFLSDNPNTTPDYYSTPEGIYYKGTAVAANQAIFSNFEKDNIIAQTFEAVKSKFGQLPLPSRSALNHAQAQIAKATTMAADSDFIMMAGQSKAFRSFPGDFDMDDDMQQVNDRTPAIPSAASSSSSKDKKTMAGTQTDSSVVVKTAAELNQPSTSQLFAGAIPIGSRGTPAYSGTAPTSLRPATEVMSDRDIFNQLTSHISVEQKALIQKKLQEMATKDGRNADALSPEILHEFMDFVTEGGRLSTGTGKKEFQPKITHPMGTHNALTGTTTPGIPSGAPIPITGSSSSTLRRTHSEGDDVEARTPSINHPKFNVDKATESNNDTPLTMACANGHTQMVEVLVSRGANMEHRDKKGFTPLIMAATGGHVGVVELLLAKGANLEAQSERTKDTALSLACSGGRKEVVELLLRKNANKEHRNVSDYTPLSLAASGGYVDIVNMLLNAGAEINSRTGSKLGISPLMLAAMNGHKEATRVLLEKGSDINAQIETNRNTALTLACFQGRTDVVRLLLQYGANVEHRAKTGLTPLMEAANGGYVEVGDLLLDACADPNTSPVPSSRDTALTIAADKGHEKFVELLVHRGAFIDARNKKGCTALWLACHGGHLKTVQTLLKHGADVDAQDNRKVSPLMIGFRKGNVEVVKLMVEHAKQFPGDQELTRYTATLTATDLIKTCQECVLIIVKAKDEQASQANKAAEDLLALLAEEEEKAETKKRAKALKNQKKKEKKTKKTEPEKDKSPAVDAKKEEEEVVESDDESESAASANFKKEVTPPQPITVEVEERVPVETPVKAPEPIVLPSSAERPPSQNGRQKRQTTRRTRNESGKSINGNAAVAVPPTPPPPATLKLLSPIPSPKNPIAEEWVKASGKKTKQASSKLVKTGVSSSALSAAQKDYYLDENGAYGGWKDVELSRRRSNTLLVCNTVIARVIGRGGANINAIREVTGASIEVEKQSVRRDQHDRQIFIRGTQETVKNATLMINGLVADSDATVADIIRQIQRGNATSVASSVSSEGGSRLGSICETTKTTAPSNATTKAGGQTASAPAAPTQTTNVWHQRMAARQQQMAQASPPKDESPLPSAASPDTTTSQPSPPVSTTEVDSRSVTPPPPQPPATVAVQPQPTASPAPATPAPIAVSASPTPSPAPIQPPITAATPPIQEAPLESFLSSNRAVTSSIHAPSEEELRKAPGYRPANMMQNQNSSSLDSSSSELSRMNSDLNMSIPITMATTAATPVPIGPPPNAALRKAEAAAARQPQLGSLSDISDMFDQNSMARMAEIWSSDADQSKQPAWESQLNLDSFKGLNISNSMLTSDWGSEAAALFGIPSSPTKQSSLSSVSTPSNLPPFSSSHSDWISSAPAKSMPLFARPQARASSLASTPLPAPLPMPPGHPQQQQQQQQPRYPTNSVPMSQSSDHALFNKLAAQLAQNSQQLTHQGSAPTGLPTHPTNYYHSSSYTDPAVLLSTPQQSQINKFASNYQSYQAANNEFEALSNLINSYHSPAQNGYMQDANKPQHAYPQSPSVSRSMTAPASRQYAPPAPPGFAALPTPQPQQSMTAANTAIPPPSLRPPFYNAQMPPPQNQPYNMYASQNTGGVPPNPVGAPSSVSSASWMAKPPGINGGIPQQQQQQPQQPMWNGGQNGWN